MITARDRSGQTDGQITLQFQGPNADLRSWDVIDATGARTRITLSDVTQPASFDRSLSVYSNVRARDDAENRAAKTIADDLKARLSAFLSNDKV